MARLPIPGSDKGSWGSVLNDFLSQAHEADGSLKDGSVTPDSIADDAITESKLDPAARAKLNTAGGTTNLSASANATTITVASDTGNDAVIPAATTSDAGVLSAADKTKLNGIATGATANASDAQLRDRSTHTGSQAISTVTGLQTALDGKAASSHTHTIANVTNLQTSLNSKANTADLSSVATSGSYNDLTNVPTIPTALGTLSDVSTAGASTGQVLKYDGSSWSPAEDDTSSGGPGGATNLTSSANATSVTVLSDTGTDATISAATPSVAGVMTAADKTKLNGVATGATANASDAQLRDRSTHTGSQAISTVTGLQNALDGKQETGDYVEASDLAAVATSGTLDSLSDVSTSGVSNGQVLKYNGSSWAPATDSTGTGATNLTTAVNATTATVLSDTGTDAVIPAATASDAGVMSAADKTKLNGIATGATANATDSQLRDRSTHTGAQAISTVTGLQTALDGKAASSHTHAIADVTNLQTSLDGKAATSHNHSAANITSGVLATARLGSGTANNTTYLRGDGAWAAVSGGAGSESRFLGTNTVIVAGHNESQDIKDIADYVCDNTADQDQINAAIAQIATVSVGGNAKGTNGGTVLLVGREFTISGPILVQSQVTLQGAYGKSATWIRCHSSYAPGDAGGMIELANEDAQYVTICDLGLRAEGVNVCGIRLAMGAGQEYDGYHVVTNIYMWHTGSHGLYITKTSSTNRMRGGHYSYIRIIDPDGHGVYIDSPDSFYNNIDVGSAGVNGFYIAHSNNMITNCKAWFSGNDGFHVPGAAFRDNVLSNCSAQDNARHGFYIAGPRHVLSSCSADSNGYISGGPVPGNGDGFHVAINANGLNLQGTASDKNESARGLRQRYGVNIASATTNVIVNVTTWHNAEGHLNGTGSVASVVNVIDTA